MFIYFLTTDINKAVAEAAEAGWTRVAFNRWATAGRDDVRIIRRMSEFQLIPGGSYIMPARDLLDVSLEDNHQPYLFKELVDSGAAQWWPNPNLGDAGTKALVMRIKSPPPPLENFLSKQEIANRGGSEEPPLRSAPPTGRRPTQRE